MHGFQKNKFFFLAWTLVSYSQETVPYYWCFHFYGELDRAMSNVEGYRKETTYRACRSCSDVINFFRESWGVENCVGCDSYRRVGTCQEIRSGKKFFEVREFNFDNSGKVAFWRRVKENWNNWNTTDLIPVNTGKKYFGFYWSQLCWWNLKSDQAMSGQQSAPTKKLTVITFTSDSVIWSHSTGQEIPIWQLSINHNMDVQYQRCMHDCES